MRRPLGSDTLFFLKRRCRRVCPVRRLPVGGPKLGAALLRCLTRAGEARRWNLWDWMNVDLGFHGGIHMRADIIALMAILVLPAGCTTAGDSVSAGAANQTAAASQRAAASSLAGRWSGQTASGGSIIVSIPPSGTPSYTFRGENVPVRSSRMSGDNMVLTVGTGGGQVTLSPRGDGSLEYSYRFQGQSASAVLMRS